MGSSTKEVGGGAATGLSNDFINFLSQGLKTGSFTGGGATSGGSTPTGFRPNVPFAGGTGGPNIGPGFGGNQIGQTTGPDAFGRSNPVGSTQGIGDVLNRFLGGQFGNQSYGADTSGLKAMGQGGGFNFAAFNPQLTDFSKFNTNALSSFDPTANIGSMIQRLQPQAAQTANFNLGNVDLSPYTAQLARQKMIDQANLRARYGASGGGGFGTGASTAEGNYLAATNAANASTLGQIGQSQQALELQRQYEAGNINAENYRALLQAQQQAGQTGAGLFTSANAQRLAALTSASGLNLDALKAASQQGIDVQSLFNQNQGIQAQNQLGNRGLNIDALSRALGIDLQGQGLTEGARQFNVGEQGRTLQDLLSLYAGLSSKGIAQRQVVSTPSAGANILGGLTGLAGAAGNIFGSGLFGGGNNQLQNFGPPQDITGGVTNWPGANTPGYSFSGATGVNPSFDLSAYRQIPYNLAA